MKNSMRISYYDRYTQSIEDEKIYASNYLNWCYNTRMGNFLTDLIFSRRFISCIYGWYNRRSWTKKKISDFLLKYKINQKEILKPIESFKNFNDFFVRDIDLSQREIKYEANICISPVDGKVIVYPEIDSNDEFVIKRHVFNIRELIQDDSLTDLYSGGSLLISRLHLADYHHFHFPVNCIPTQAMLIKGRYYAGGHYSETKYLPYYSLNKRMISVLNSEFFDKILMIEIGAMTVGSIKQNYQPDSNTRKGTEKGYFELGGSTIVLLFKKNTISFDSDLINNSINGLETYVKMGDSIGQRFS